MEAALQKAKARSRAVYVYELPDEIKILNDEYVRESIGLVKLTMDEEMSGAERAAGVQAKMAYNWARSALVEVDGRPLKKDEAEDEAILRNTDPVIRDLILEAYADISTNPKEVTKKFLKSRKVKVG